MIKIIKITILLFCIFLLITTYLIYITSKQLKEQVQNKQQTITHTEPQQTTPTISPEEKYLTQMTIKQKVGQLFIFGIEGNTYIDSANKQFLLETEPAGIILFERNISNEQQLINLISELQTTNTIKMFVAIDQEGGVVPRIKWNKTLTLSQKGIKTSEDSYNIAKEKGTILNNLGINMNLAPVVEYVSSTNAFIYARTFSGNIDQVISKSSNALKGYKDSNTIPVAKHFPGHGENSLDPHKTEVTVNINDSQWNQYIKPFSSLLETNDIDAMMVGHILFPNIDRYPASISNEIITNRLRSNLSYNGVVMSDDMQMKALDTFGTVEELAKQALLSGEDILIYSKFVNRDDGLQKRVYKYILEEVEKGNINIDEKVKRVLRLKDKYNIINLD